MAYSQALVIAGGIAHVPIVISVLKFLDTKTAGIHNAKEAAANKAKALKEAAIAKEKAAAAQAEAAAKARADAAAKQAEINSSNNNSEA